MKGSGTCVNWRIASTGSSPKQRLGERRPRHSSSWHTAIFRPVSGVPTRTSISPPPIRRRSSARLPEEGVNKRHRNPPVPRDNQRDPSSLRCACCCLPNLSGGPVCYQCCCCSRRRHLLQVEQVPAPEDTQPVEDPPQTPSPPPSPDLPPTEESEPQTSRSPSTNPQTQPSQPCCSCLHFLGGSPYFPAPEPDTWQFVYWPPLIPRSSRKTLPFRPPSTSQSRKSVSSTPVTRDDVARQSKSTRVVEPTTKRTRNNHSQTSPKSAPPKYSVADGVSYCKGGWRCKCSKYELPESCILAPLPATPAPYVETTLLVPTSTRVIIPAAPGLSRRSFRVCIPPSELPMCHCPPDCPCPHPRCPIENQSSRPCAGLFHPKCEQDEFQEMDRPKVLFGRDPLIKP